MGYGSWDPGTWSTYSSKTSTKSTATIFKSSGMNPKLDPRGVLFRESRDSDKNPNSTAIIVGLDVTGSMGEIAGQMARNGLGVLFQEILDRKPVTDPHLMFMAIGDVECDRAPLQVSQFEADASIIPQLEDIFLEGGGGGNSHESYHFPWYFAATHTSIDCYEKRKKKGYLFTIGDEEAPRKLGPDHIRAFLGEDAIQSYSAKELFEMASKMYHVFHVVVEQGSHCRYDLPGVLASWNDMIGAQHVLRLADSEKLSEVIVSAIQVVEGDDKDAVAKSWSGDTSIVVRKAIDSIVSAKSSGRSVTRL